MDRLFSFVFRDYNPVIYEDLSPERNTLISLMFDASQISLRPPTTLSALQMCTTNVFRLQIAAASGHTGQQHK